MTELNITEATTVQFPIVRHAAEIGWTPLSPQDALHKRGGEAGMLFRDEIKGWVERLLGKMQQQDIERNPDKEPVLLPLKERAESILKELENRQTTGLAAMDRLAALAAEKDAAIRAARDSGLSPHTFAVHWALKDEAKLKIAGIDTLELAQRAETLLDRFPNAAVNDDEQRRLHTALYAQRTNAKRPTPTNESAAKR